LTKRRVAKSTGPRKQKRRPPKDSTSPRTRRTRRARLTANHVVTTKIPESQADISQNLSTMAIVGFLAGWLIVGVIYLVLPLAHAPAAAISFVDRHSWVLPILLSFAAAYWIRRVPYDSANVLYPNAFYVRTQACTDDVSAVIHSKLPEIMIEAGKGYCRGRLSDSDFLSPEASLMQLSSELDTDVICLSYRYATGAFQFHHWRSGNAMRSLVYNCFLLQHTWERAEGKPEPWEEAVLFTAWGLKRTLWDLRSAGHERELRRSWETRELLAGMRERGFDSLRAARKVAEHYQLPGWPPQKPDAA